MNIKSVAPNTWIVIYLPSVGNITVLVVAGANKHDSTSMPMLYRPDKKRMFSSPDMTLVRVIGDLEVPV